MTEAEQETLPAIFEHMCNVYKEMESEAKLVTAEVLEEGHAVQLVWSGHLTKLFARLRLSVPYYTSVTRELKRMGCIKQLRRGGGNAPSQWLVLTEPTEEAFRSDWNRTGTAASRKADRVTALEQRVRDLSKVVDRIKDDYDTIIDILQEKEEESA